MGKFTEAFEKTASPQLRERRGEGGQARHGKAQSVSSSPRLGKVDVQVTGNISPNCWDERLFLATESQSPVAERFRRLRGAILHPPSGKRPRTILITSLVPNEGKGFVCANLGVALAEEMEHHALMVDCDFRRPNLARMFGVENQTGLVDYLQDSTDLGVLIRKTKMPKLSLLPSGRPPHNPAELLTSKKILGVIDELAQRYDDRIILIDSSPNVVASEASILAKRVDGVILVVRWGASSKELVQRFAQTLGLDRIIGVVFNGYKESKVDSLLYKNSSSDYQDYYA